MERNKMGREFAEKLNQREIQPSRAAWDRLDAMLTATEATSKSAKRRNFKWLYVAASFLGFLLIGTLFFKQGSKLADSVSEPQVVSTPKTDTPSQTVVPIGMPQTQIAQSGTSEKIQKPRGIRKTERTASDLKIPQQIADNTAVSQQQQQASSVINQKMQSAPAKTYGASAEELLAAAQAKRESNGSGAKVSARSLLSQVDSQDEQQLTLRQKAIRALNKNYQHVKVAVENRNLEENH